MDMDLDVDDDDDDDDDDDERSLSLATCLLFASTTALLKNTMPFMELPNHHLSSSLAAPCCDSLLL